jgi:hypothetical protein
VLIYGHTTSHIPPTCEIGLCSLTLPAPEAGGIVEFLLLYLLFQSAVLQNLHISFFFIHHVEGKVLEFEIISSSFDSSP